MSTRQRLWEECRAGHLRPGAQEKSLQRTKRSELARVRRLTRTAL